MLNNYTSHKHIIVYSIYSNNKSTIRNTLKVINLIKMLQKITVIISNTRNVKKKYLQASR